MRDSPVSAWVRNLLALGLVILAVAHVAYPSLGIDAVMVGLLLIAAAVFFRFHEKLDLESLDVFGVHAKVRGQIREIRTEKAVVEAVATENLVAPPPDTSEPRQIAEGQSEMNLTKVEAAEFEVLPPVDTAERLIWVATQIQIELVIIAGNSGLLPDRRPFGQNQPLDLAHMLMLRGIVPGELVPAISTVASARNSLVHGERGAKAIAPSASDLGLQLVSKLRAIQRNWFRVLDSGVEVFRGEVNPVPYGIAGIVLEQLDAAGKQTHVLAFPGDVAYARSAFVSWEWDMRRIYKYPAFIRDPKSSALKHAWGASAKFVGRAYPSEWDLESRAPGALRLDG